MLVDEMLTHTEIIHALRDSEIGTNLPIEDLERLASIANVLSMEEGEFLTEEGADGHHIYFLISGRVEIQICTDDGSNPAGSLMLHAGAIIGEMSVLESARRTATTKVLEHTTFLCLHDQDLWDLFDEDPRLGYQFMRNMACILSRRLRMTNLAIRNSFFMD
jgi:CRP-like cAMP-binding protein